MLCMVLKVQSIFLNQKPVNEQKINFFNHTYITKAFVQVILFDCSQMILHNLHEAINYLPKKKKLHPAMIRINTGKEQLAQN